MKKLVPILALLAGASAPSLAAGTGSVEGTLVEAPTSKMVSGRVDVVCNGVRKSGRADANGHFLIDGLPEGTCTLTAAGGEFVTVTMNVAVTGGSIATVLVNVTSRDYADKIRRDQERAQAEMAKQQREYQKRMKKMYKGRGGGGQMYMEDGDFAGGVEGGVMGGEVNGVMPAPPPAMAPPRMAPMPAPPRPPANAKMPAGGAGKDVATKAKAVEAPRADAPRDATVMRGAGSAAGPMPAATPAAQAPMGNMPVQPATIVMLDDAKKQAQIVAQKRELARRNRADKNIAANIARAQENGWAMVRVFPVPDAQAKYEGPRTDFRETIYWNGAVETDARGKAEVAFTTSDAVTSFRATAEGFSTSGAAGGGEVAVSTKLPLSIDAKLPVEVTSGDSITLPVTIANNTDEAMDATLNMAFGTAFRMNNNPAEGKIRIAPGDKTTIAFQLAVVATDGDADFRLKASANGMQDELKKQIRVVPKGFPIELSASGTAKKGNPQQQVIDLQGALPGSVHASVTMYPSPVAAIASGMDGMIREPGGCFEQASSTNYPNIMILGYLDSTSQGADPQLVAKTKGVLDKGYKLLTGYETPEKGYEWFGQTPGHEALTAYGLMEFADMSKVYTVDPSMVERTATWLMSRRDQQGGFQRNQRALDSFGRASAETTNAYIMWALSQAKRSSQLTKELDVQKKLGDSTSDPYLLSLATTTAFLNKEAEGGAMAKKLAGLQAKDGSFPGAKETITMSGGESLTIEATALSVIALLEASPNNEYETQIRAGVEWLNGKRGGYGAWGNTQATILGLKALTAYSQHARQMQTGGTATLVINGKDAGAIKFDKGRRDALVWNDFAGKLAPGKNTVEVRMDGGASLPYTVAVDFRSTQPASARGAKVKVATQLLQSRVKMGEGVTLRAHVENTTNAGIPMTLARIGLPGGTVFQTWQLKELRDKGLIDFYETRPREVILYWRAMAPGAKKDVDLNLLASVPGTYEGPASSTYLYYTAEDKAWAKPLGITIDK